ncbi:MAG: FAD/NAD(P)-binding protein [Acidobacteriota bacterium]
MNLDWLVIGGGIHGVHIAARLVGEGHADPERLRLLDPADTLLARWRACTAVTGMRYLRSTSVHHLDLDPWSLQRFAGKRRTRRRNLFASRYDRPSLELFNSHCDHVVETYGLDALHIRDRATTCAADGDGVTVQTVNGLDLVAQNLVLAIGSSDFPDWPTWAPRDHPRVRHVFELGFNAWPSDGQESVAVVGGGISAGQVALRLVEEGHEVFLVSRHAFRKHQFDSDPGWLGPKNMMGYSRERSLDRRREIINTARHRGSVPPDVWTALRNANDMRLLTRHIAEIEDLAIERDVFRMRLSTAESIIVDRVLLATGFVMKRPGGTLVDSLITSASLPCARCGFPVVDTALRWHPRIRVTGPLAELELGPVSRTIAGVRRAGDRIIKSLETSSKRQKAASLFA